MAVISRRPRLKVRTRPLIRTRPVVCTRSMICAALAAALLAAGCSLLKPVPTAVQSQERAQHLAAEGKHSDAARAYAELAAQAPAERDNYELLAAEQWVLAGDTASAKQAMAEVSPEARTTMPASRALVAAEIALAENDGARAIRELDSIAVPTQPISRRIIGGCAARARSSPDIPSKARAPSSSGSATCTDPASLRASRAELFALLRTASERGTPMKPPPKTDPIVAGWLALGPVAVEMARNPMHASAALDDLETRLPAASGQRQRADRWRRTKSRPRRSFPIRSHCCCRSPAAPSRSALPCAMASLPPISNRTPPRGRI